jgi:hypothetical protein
MPTSRQIGEIVNDTTPGQMLASALAIFCAARRTPVVGRLRKAPRLTSPQTTALSTSASPHSYTQLN